MAEAAIKELGDKIVGLTLKEAVDLGDYLKEEYGIEPAAGAVAVAAGPAAADAAEEQTEFAAVLTAAGDQKIKVIKVVREITGLGLKEAKDLVDNTPKPLKEGASKEEAEGIAEKIKEVGGTVEVK
tara:strand:+ start:97 stop:474 length:378 start_codon:yes stop_codon:yes gene_type:complete